MKTSTTHDVGSLVEDAKHILVIQGDNPDADSLGSALALEEILGDMGKEVTLMCGVQIPRHLSYLDGWDRVTKELPGQFDAAIIVDTGAITLLDSLTRNHSTKRFASKPVLVIDHHDAECDIPFATLIWNKKAVATAEIIYELAHALKWRLSQSAKASIAAAILSDSLGLTSEAVTARSVHIVAEIVESGVSLAKLEQKRRAAGRKSPELLKYKGLLLQRVEYYADDRIAVITIPWVEIEKYSPLYNPPMLVMDEMRSVEGVAVAIAFKSYNDGKVTAKIRCNVGQGIASRLAEPFGGGGHAYAAGFKIISGETLETIKNQTLVAATELLDNLTQK